mmetsp:Transcript_95537/g.275869  ORF Transcript_95537/g.275869 Transcript_95537/m.275869 type:complete len:97 (-) Transcript_95537:278-568(-)
MPGDGEGAAAGKDEEEKPGRSCGEAFLDFGACLIRGGVQTGSAVAWGTRYTCYPVKETVVQCIDGTQRHLQPYRKREVGNSLAPQFAVNGASSSNR